MEDERVSGINCPVPHRTGARITMAHGGGGTVTSQLLEDVFFPAFDNPMLQPRHDAASLGLQAYPIAFTTDSYVVKPIFFPGGDIGSLAVCGTINDLAMAGARPRFLSAAFILEEGLETGDLKKVVHSMKEEAARCGAAIVTGDTKTVERHGGDGLFITMAGIGTIEHGLTIDPAHVRPGDAIVVSGDLGRHGIAIMAARENLEFESPVLSDCAPLVDPVLALIESGVDVHCLRDLTRGGLAAAVHEIAVSAGLCCELREAAVPVQDTVRGACEILGLDPLHVANEGRFIAFVPEADLDVALGVLRTHAEDCEPALIGRVLEQPAGVVQLISTIGVPRILQPMSGTLLPRIC